MSIEADILRTPPQMKYEEPAPEVSWEAFQAIVESRRSVRVFLPTPIPDLVVKKCLSAALLSANSSNLQAWEFYWVKSHAAKSKLVEACLSQPAASTAQTLIVCVARTKTWKKHRKQMLEAFDRSDASGGFRIPYSAREYYLKLVPFAYTQGWFGILGWGKKVLTSLIGIFKAIPREPNSHYDMKVWATKTTSLASQTLMLAFRAAGFDSCPMEGIDSKRIRKLLKLPRDASVVMVIGAGKRAPNGIYGPRLRFDEEQFVHEL